LILPTERVYVGIGPDIWRGEGGLLFGELPRFEGDASCPDRVFAVDVGFDLLLAQNKLGHFGSTQMARFALSVRAGGRDAELYRGAFCLASDMTGNAIMSITAC
jgi:hypothetical protein